MTIAQRLQMARLCRMARPSHSFLSTSGDYLVAFMNGAHYRITPAGRIINTNHKNTVLPDGSYHSFTPSGLF